MNKNWVKTERGRWLNLAHAYCIFVRNEPTEKGFWEICICFMKPDTIMHVLSSHKTEKFAYDEMEKLMSNLHMLKS